jgi:hypothetical protein
MVISNLFTLATTVALFIIDSPLQLLRSES